MIKEPITFVSAVSKQGFFRYLLGADLQSSVQAKILNCKKAPQKIAKLAKGYDFNLLPVVQH